MQPFRKIRKDTTNHKIIYVLLILCSFSVYKFDALKSILKRKNRQPVCRLTACFAPIPKFRFLKTILCKFKREYHP